MHGEKNDRGGAESAPPPMGLGLSQSLYKPPFSLFSIVVYPTWSQNLSLKFFLQSHKSGHRFDKNNFERGHLGITKN